MDNMVRNKKIVFFSFIFVFVCMGIGFIIFNFEKLGIINVSTAGFIMLSLVALSIYYFHKYIQTINFTNEAVIHATKGKFIFSSYDYNDDYEEFVSSLKDIEKQLLSFQNSFSKTAYMDEKKLEGIYRNLALRYNELLKRSDENKEKLENEIESINNQIKNLYTAISSGETIAQKHYKGEVLKLAEKIDILQKNNNKYLLDINAYSKKLLEGNYTKIPTAGIPGEVSKVYESLNLYSENNNKKLKEIGELMQKMASGKENIEFKEEYKNEYAIIKNNMEKLLKTAIGHEEYKSTINKNSKTTATEQKSTADKAKKRVVKTNDAYLNTSVPKTPKNHESFDHVFESTDYGKYSRA